MWKDWQELGLIIILGMLFAGLMQQVNLSGEGSMFAGMQHAVPAATQSAKQPAGQGQGAGQVPAATSTPKEAAPKTLRYQNSGDGSHISTFVYGPAREARMVCRDRLAVLHWKRDNHSVQLPPTCYLMPEQTGVYTSSSPV